MKKFKFATEKCKNIKKGWKITIIVLALLLALLSGGSIALRSSYVQTKITQKLAKQLSQQTNTTISIGRVDVAFFHRVILNNVLIEAQDGDTLFYTEWVSAKIDTLKIRKHKLAFSELLFENNKINIKQDSAQHFNFSFLLDSLNTEKDTSVNWDLSCNQFGFQQSSVSFADVHSNKETNIFLHDLNLNISSFKNYKDSVFFNINSLDLNDGKELFLEQLSAEVVANKEKIEFKSINLKSRSSLVEDSELSVGLKNNSDSKSIEPEFDFRLAKSELSLMELAEFIPSLRGMNQKIKLAGRIYGNLDDLKGKNVVLEMGNSTKAVLDFYINGINDLETMYLFLDLKQSATTISDISRIRLPNVAKINYVKFPEAFYKSGRLTYTGNFSGFLSDFVSFGTLKSKMGILKTDLSVVPKDQGTVRYQGKVSTDGFKLGELLKINSLGDITFSGEVDGNYNPSDNTIGGLFKGDVPFVEINKYVYTNIQLDGLYMDKMFDGLLSINDPGLKFDFQGQVDLNEETPEFNFILKLKHFLLGKLNLSIKYPNAELAFDMKAKFTGNKIDNLRGVILVDNGLYQNKNGQFNLENIQLISVPNDSLQTLSFTSDFFDVNIEGNYQFQTILNSFRKTINKFLPEIAYETQIDTKINNFNYQIDVKNIDNITSTFYPGLKFETPFLLYGKVESGKSDIQLEGSIPGFEYKDIWVRNIFIGNKVIEEKYSSKFKFGEILHRNGMKIYDFTVDSEVANNIVQNQISWKNTEDSTTFSSIQSKIILSKSDTSSSLGIFAEYFPSDIFIADSLWHIDHFTAALHASEISINNFNLHRDKQNLSVNGNVSKDKFSKLLLNFSDIDLGFIEKNLGRDGTLGGLINCSVSVSDFYGDPVLVSDVTIDSLRFDKFIIGDINFVSQWDKENARVNSKLQIAKNNRRSLIADGYFIPKTKQLNYNLFADSLSLKLLGIVITNNLSGFEGFATGNVNIQGSLDDIRLNGAVNAAGAGVTIDYTQGHYTFTDSVYFKSDAIQFDHITIQDRYGNKGNFNGVLVHENFKNMIYDITLNSPKILALNTSYRDNGQFYGEVFANCKMSITGQGRTVVLKGQATTLKGTEVYISMDYESDFKQYDFVEFKRTEEEEEDKEEIFFARDLKGDFSIRLTVEATPESKVQLIYNTQIGDVIKAQGEGILLFEMDKDWNISLSGDYTLTEGDYLFTLQNLVNKRFSIEQGGTIVWSGDPYNAIIRLTAVYKLKAMLSDLMVESYLIDDISQRIPVECKILLSEELTDPVINFDIDFPEENETLVGMLQQYINTEEELNRQILSLIVLGKFYTPEYVRGLYDAQNTKTLGTTASDLFSSQLSSVLSQISNDVDVGLNYRPGNSITNDEIELALSTQIFNDRVTLNGNIGNNVNPESNNSSQIVGDFDIKVKLVPSGKIQFKAFNRSNNNLIYDTAPYTQGIGMSFKEEYNTFGELFKKIGSIFKRKNKI